MAYQSIWYFTDLPEKVVDLIAEDLTEKFDPQMADSKLHGDSLNKEKRDSQNAWVPTTHWVGGLIWHYIQRANRENFLYDLRCIDGESMQYTRYETGQFYGWHNDAGQEWVAWDDSRSPYNEITTALYLNANLTEASVGTTRKASKTKYRLTF